MVINCSFENKVHPGYNARMDGLGPSAFPKSISRTGVVPLGEDLWWLSLFLLGVMVSNEWGDSFWSSGLGDFVSGCVK